MAKPLFSPKNPKLVILSAPSGAGKTTLCSRLLQYDLSLVLSISFTTRKPRGSEMNGKEYHFVTQEHFETMISQGHFAEYARVHDNYYGTSKTLIEQNLKAGKSVVLDIDYQGALNLKAQFPKESILVFIEPPSLEILEKRLRDRQTEPTLVIQKRIKNAKVELEQKHHFDVVIQNNDLDEAFQRLIETLKAQSERTNN